MVTVGGVVSRLLTITVTGAEVAVLPAASRATAVSVWVPFGARVVVQATVYGGALTSTPRLVPSSLNCTPATPTLSEALADTVTVPVTVAPAGGAAIETAGGVTSGGAPVQAPSKAHAVASLRASISAPRSFPSVPAFR